MVAHKLAQFPVELVEHIISTAWHMPLTSDERITFMRSSALVNSTWADIFDLVSRDVYIPSAAFCDHFTHRLLRDHFTQRSRSQAHSSAILSSLRRLLDRFRGQAKPSIQARSANLRCQSLTIQIPNVDVHPDCKGRTRQPMAGVLDDLLEIIDAHSLVPNLRRLSIEYVDTGFDDVLHRVALAALPPQVTHLDLRYSFSSAMPSWLVEALRRKQGRETFRSWWIARSVTRLSVHGAGKFTVEQALRACPNTQILEVDGSVAPIVPVA
ncbi:hypothetical protein DFH06DRAFT_337358 [Mycena polygramma]|nr:hypothetical protein DFH06DRAFT_337358 [Mycena polygramma]